ncbi:CATRA system-associated protein [Amycolatopsis sp. WQ 127309]|uniref:CATRA system-associated protein n=1 Tax=Amycolatopsis sp. WQ 127309 TaxID=2932773 RepID=UPI001FF5946F|nr:CATRA system-associated protein [Amycolatopsis sp. WQ 127309]UOZ11349.1 hypothetical protein MUY22_25005 [Amycolatopsis sp. WQ 127309]
MITAFHSSALGQRVFAARAAAQLHRWGYRTLLVEAVSGPGGILPEYADAGGREPASYPEPGAGAPDVVRLGRTADLDELYADHGLGWHLEDCATSWRSAYDHVVVDAGSGLDDATGICLAQLPDTLVLAGEPGSVASLATEASRVRDQLPFGRGKLTVLPLLTGVGDTRAPLALLDAWAGRDTDRARLLTVLATSLADGDVEPVTALLARDLAATAQLVADRPAYVRGAARVVTARSDQVYEDAADVLTDLLEWELDPAQWASIEHELALLAEALRAGSANVVDQLTRGLELAAPVLSVGTSGDAVSIPASARALVKTSLNLLAER